MRLSTEDIKELTQYLISVLKRKRFSVGINRFGTITNAEKFGIRCCPAIVNSTEDGRQGYAYIQLSVNPYSEKDLGSYYKPRTNKSSHKLYDKNNSIDKYAGKDVHIDKHNYKQVIETFVSDLNKDYMRITKKHEDLDLVAMGEPDFVSEINNYKQFEICKSSYYTEDDVLRLRYDEVWSMVVYYSSDYFRAGMRRAWEGDFDQEEYDGWLTFDVAYLLFKNYKNTTDKEQTLELVRKFDLSGDGLSGVFPVLYRYVSPEENNSVEEDLDLVPMTDSGARVYKEVNPNTNLGWWNIPADNFGLKGDIEECIRGLFDKYDTEFTSIKYYSHCLHKSDVDDIFDDDCLIKNSFRISESMGGCILFEIRGPHGYVVDDMVIDDEYGAGDICDIIEDWVKNHQDRMPESLVESLVKIKDTGTVFDGMTGTVEEETDNKVTVLVDFNDKHKVRNYFKKEQIELLEE